MYGVGVDLGTSYAAAAVALGRHLETVRLGSDAAAIPSVAYLDDGGTLLTGEPAARFSADDPARSAREFKRRLGDQTPLLLAGAPHSPAILMAAELRDVLRAVRQSRGGEPPRHVVLTYPAVWGPYRQEQFSAVPHLAGLGHPGDDSAYRDPAAPAVRLVTEPVAAATYYCRTHPLPPDGLLAVYDLGGGTFDCAVVRNRASGIEIVGNAEGVEWLGGADFDQAVMGHVDRALDGAVTALDPADPDTPRILTALRHECMRAKEALSTRSEVTVTAVLPGGVHRVGLTQDTFEQMIAPSLDTTIEAFRRMLTAAGVTPQDLSAVLLAGGSSQIPVVGRLLRDTIRRPVLADANPKHVVAMGAALLSAAALGAAGDSAPSSGTTALRGHRSAGLGSSVFGSFHGPASGAQTPSGGRPVAAGPAPTAAGPAPTAAASTLAAAASPPASAASGLAGASGPALASADSAERTQRIAVRARQLKAPRRRPMEPMSPEARARRTRRYMNRLVAAGAALLVAGAAGAIVGVLAAHGEDTPGAAATTAGGTGPALADLVLFNGAPSIYKPYVSSEDNGWNGLPLTQDTAVSGQSVSVTTAGGVSRGTSRLLAEWSGSGPGQFYLEAPAARNMQAYAAAASTLTFDITVHNRPAARTVIEVHCGYPCESHVEATTLFKSLPLEQQRTIRIPLACFVDAGLDVSKVDTFFLIETGGRFDASFSDIRWEPGAAKRPDAQSCAKLT